VAATFDQGKDDIAKKCLYFATNRDQFHKPGVKEAHVRQMLIDPFFEALGWDVCNREQVAPQYREVVTEDSLEVEGHQRAPDYDFRVTAFPKFYAEAKKCVVDIKNDPQPAFQLRRYGFSAKIALSVLTNFEAFAVYDCTIRPYPSNKASHARLQIYGFEEYPDRWRELWDLFSREAVRSGAFDNFAASKRKRGTSEVDDEFLKEIEGWRDILARNFALRNDWLSTDDLNAAVQMTIDRVVFLRMAEDKSLEPYGQLLKLCERPDIYARFMRDFCRRADEKYNSGLFHFRREAEFSDAPDQITPKLSLDDKVFKPILEGLYMEHGCPYHFGILPVEILGTVYERFLGKVIRLTAGHQAKVEEKPEVRKAGGVYYTPKYIVDYIVKQTVGRQIEGKSPAELAGGKGQAPFRVLDMACGSGSFLLGAYQCLLDYCLRWYSERDPAASKKAAFQYNSQWRLAIEEKKRILTTHIFGVDIDRQAVEVTKLSLLLKALEGENDASFSQQLDFFPARVLPNLADNIKCGNSLIGTDILDGHLFEADDELKLNPMNFEDAFPEIMKRDRFDAVIGNPPYIRIQTMQETSPASVEYLAGHYRAAKKGNYDIYVVFVERALSLLNSQGRLGFILPHKFFNAQYGQPLRGLIAEGKHLAQVVHFGDQQVFERATTYTCLMFLDKKGIDVCRFVKVDDLPAWKVNEQGKEGTIPSSQVTADGWNFNVGGTVDVFQKLMNSSAKPAAHDLVPVLHLGDLTHLFVGLQTDADDVFIMEGIKADGDLILCQSKATGKEHWFEEAHLKPFLKGSLNIRRYCLANATKRLIFPYETRDNKSELIGPDDYKQRFPLTWDYLQINRQRLAERNKKRMGREWYGYVYKKNHTRFWLPKIVVPSIAVGSCFAADFEGRYFFVGSGGGGGGGYGIVLDETSGLSASYLLGVLNSCLLSAVIRTSSTPFRGGYFALNRQYIEQLPIRTINFSDSADKSRHDRMVQLVEQILEAKKQLATAQSDKDRSYYESKCAGLDRQIDRLVYDLYGLTEEEIAIVEAGA